MGAVTGSPRRRSAFTLVEILIVTFILMLLAGIALPAVRNALKDGKKAQSAREVVAFLNEARGRAIATGREVGVLIPRFGSANDYVRSISNQMVLSNSVPPYTGETAAARALLFHDPDPQNSTIVPDPPQEGATNAAFFTADDSPLLFLSAANGGTGSSPIRRFDRLEMQGGRSVVIRRMMQVADTDTPPGFGPGTKVIFDPREELFDERTAANTAFNRTVIFPSSAQLTSTRTPARFRIHREPVTSTVGSLSLSKGLAIDLNYSGVGHSGIQFSQFVMAPSALPDEQVECGNVAIVFAPDGSVSYMKHGVDISGGSPVLSQESPAGNIYLCLGTTDGVRPDDLLSLENRATANVMNPETVWVVINPSTGFITASPAAAPQSQNNVRVVVRESRAFAVQADTLSTY